MSELSDVISLLREGGTPMLGREMTEDEAVSLVRERFPYASFCLVRQWIWIDLVVPEKVVEGLKETNRQPVMLYAHQVVLDSRMRFQPGDWVRSTPLHSFTEGCFFRTSNTVYVLLGHGVRKSADFSIVAKIF